MIRATFWCSILSLALSVAGCLHSSEEHGEPWEEEVAEPDWRSVEPVGGEPLNNEQIDQLLARLPELETTQDDEVPFQRRDESLRPPRTREDIGGEWPPDADAPTAEPTRDAPLTVRAFRPTGEVEPPFEIAVVFDRPVVELGAVGTHSADAFELSPDIEGQWQWLGTQSATFVPEDDWPMATEFEMSVGASMEAVDGTELDETMRFEFTTPAPQIQAIFPSSDTHYTGYDWNWESRQYNPRGVHPTDAPVSVVFNQPVDDSAAEAVTVRQHESEDEIPMELASLEAAERLEMREDVLQAYREGRAVVLTPREHYRPDSEVVVEVQGPIQPEEGPLPGMADESQTFRVERNFGAFELQSISCRIKGRPCAPEDGLWLDFTNPVSDRSGIDEQVEPQIDDLRVHRDSFSVKDVVFYEDEEEPDSGRWVYEDRRRITAMRIDGDFAPRTDYTITVSGEIYDISGQQLEQREFSEEISFGDHRSGIGFPDDNFFVRPADSEPFLPVAVREMESFRARIFDVSPADWRTYLRTRRGRENYLDLTPVEQRRIRIPEGERSDYREIPVDYTAALDGRGHGQVMIIVDETEPFSPSTSYSGRRVYWIQHTDLGTQLSSDGRELTTRVTSLSNGTFVEGANVTVAGESRGRTDEFGAAQFPVPTHEEATAPVVIEHRGDSLLIPVSERPYGQGMHRVDDWEQFLSVDTALQWYVVDDRELYRPGETARIRGWIRSLEASPRSEPTYPQAHETVEYRVDDPRGTQIAAGEASVDRFGGFEFDFEVPDEANLGNAHIHLSTDSSREADRHTHTVKFEEFRRPEFEIDLHTDSEGPFMADDEIRWDARAAYYAGGTVAEAPVSWRFTGGSANFRPAGWNGWRFGNRGHSRGGSVDVQAQGDEDPAEQTDAAGRTSRRTVLHADRYVARVTGRVTVTDVNRQEWTTTHSVLVHPASTYVGLRADRRFISRGDPLLVEAVTVDLDGDPVGDRPVELTVRRRDDGEYHDVGNCRHESASEPAACQFSDLEPGYHRVVATVEDEQGRTSQSVTSAWVFGGSDIREDELSLRAERESVAVGDTARVMVRAPYYPLQAAVDLRRDGLYERREVVITEDDPIVEFAVEEAMIPNVHVRVAAIGAGDAYRTERFASGSVEIDVDRDTRQLDVEITPADDELAWNEEARVDVRVTDPSGEPVEDAQVLLYAADESVLALTDYRIPDPLSAIYPRRPVGMSDIRTHQWLKWPADTEFLMYTRPVRRAPGPAESTGMGSAGTGSAGAAGLGGAAGSFSGSGSQSEQEPISPREDFYALAFYRSDLTTDADGRVSVTEQMPDNMTRYRVMAVAVDGERYFGTGEDDVTVNRPLMVRPSPPRFLNVGDRFDFPVVIHNRQNQAISVDLAMRATSGLEWLEAPGRRVEVPADERVEVRIAARATSAGTKRVQIATATDEFSDAVVSTVPVHTPATTEDFATYGSIGPDDEDAVLQGLEVPDRVYREHGGLEVSTSSTRLQALTDAFLYLTDYPFSCSEQLASRILSVLALHDVLDAFDAAELPDPEELRASMQGWIDRLVEMQKPGGGFSLWPGIPVVFPFVSAHATLALWKASEEGYDVPSSVIPDAREYLRDIDGHIGGYSPRAAATVEAYALHVRNTIEEVEPREFEELLGRHGIEELSLEALGWLLPLAEGTQFAQRFMERITNQTRETAATAEFQETYERDANRILHTTRRTDGVVLDGLMRVDPDHYLIEKVALGLLEHRTRGRWANTQENVFILRALRRYFDLYEDVEPDFIARAWLGDQQIGEHGFEGRTIVRHSVDVPMSHLQDSEDTESVIVQRDGEGRMYYRIGLDYAPTARDVTALDRGFEVERTYEAVDDPDEVRRTDEGWEIEAGTRVRIELTMTIPARRYHVALVDWLPAGLEPVNPELEVSDVDDDLTGGSTDERSRRWWRSHWFDHQNLRDERVEAFSTLVHGGEHTYSYVARATTPGEFIAMPTQAEEMYHPETFGRTPTEVVRVVEDLDQNRRP